MTLQPTSSPSGTAHVRHTRRGDGWVVLAVTLLTLILFSMVSFGYFLGAGSDDDYLSLWTGKTLAEGRGLVNHNGQPVEIGSSLLHSLILAGFYRLAPQAVFTLNKLSGFLAGALTLTLLAWKRKTLFHLPGSWSLVAMAGALFSLAFSIYWGYWNLGGQETPFHVLILLIYAILLLETWEQPRQARWLALIQVLYILVRAEGALFILPFSLVYGLAYRWVKRQAPNWLSLVIIPLAFSLLLFGARYAWSGYWFPSPAMAKTGLDLPSRWNALKNGLKGLFLFYVRQSNLVNLLLGVASVGGVVSILRQLGRGWGGRRAVVMDTAASNLFPTIFLPALIAWNHVLILAIGIGIGMRFVIPALPLLAVFGMDSLVGWVRQWLAPRLPGSIARLLPYLTGLLICTLVMAFFLIQMRPHNPAEALVETAKRINPGQVEQSLVQLNAAHKRDIEDLLPFIEQRLPYLYAQSGNRLTIATGQMGFFPYTVKSLYPELNIRFIDVAGLSDPVIASLPEIKGPVGVLMGARIELIVTGQAGELSDYVLSQNPNLIYALEVDPAAPAILGEAGWELVWERPGGVIFYKQP